MFVFSKILSHPLTIQLVSIALIIYFLIWIFITFVPIAVVEAKYQAFKVMSSFGVTDIRSLIMPDFSEFNLQARSRYQNYGITIPSLNLDEPVVFNVDPNNEQAYTSALKQGIAHASGTAFPDNSGLGYYFAHSSNPDLRQQYNAVFYLLGKLQPGDQIFIWHEGKRFDYQVTHQLVTAPNDVSFLNQAYESEVIVLQTCWPPGTTSQRLLVFAKRLKK